MSIELDHVVRRVKGEIARERAEENRQAKIQKRDADAPSTHTSPPTDAISAMVLARLNATFDAEDATDPPPASDAPPAHTAPTHTSTDAIQAMVLARLDATSDAEDA